MVLLFFAVLVFVIPFALAFGGGKLWSAAPSIGQFGIIVLAAFLPSAACFWLAQGTGDPMVRAGSFFLVPALFVFALIPGTIGLAFARSNGDEP